MKRSRIVLYIALMMCMLLSMPAVAQTDGQQRRLKVGLVFGGGGAKGAAEVGVLKAIEEVGIPIDYIAGTSIGSIIGGLYSCGYRADDLDSLFRNQKWLRLMADPHLKLDGILSGKKVMKMLDNMTGNRDSINFDELPIPFRCVAVDIKTVSEVELSRGNLAQAMRASMSIPVVFNPVKIDNMLLMDGGILNNLPVDVVRRMGADVVIAIDLTQNKRSTKDKHSDDKGLKWLLEWVMQRPDLEKYTVNKDDCDVYINPDLKGFSAASFTPKMIREMIESGEKAGQKARKKLLALKKRVFKGEK